MPLRRLVCRTRRNGRDGVLGSAARFGHRLRGTASKGLRGLLHAQTEFLGLVGQRLRLPGQELALALRELLGFLHPRKLLSVLHRVGQRLLGHLGGLLADCGTLTLEIVRHLAGDPHQRVECSLALIETLLSELPAPGKSERGSLHCALAGLLGKFRISSHYILLPFHPTWMMCTYIF